jgi:hypothetical protein
MKIFIEEEIVMNKKFQTIVAVFFCIVCLFFINGCGNGEKEKATTKKVEPIYDAYEVYTPEEFSDEEKALIEAADALDIEKQEKEEEDAIDPLAEKISLEDLSLDFEQYIGRVIKVEGYLQDTGSSGGRATIRDKATGPGTSQDAIEINVLTKGMDRTFRKKTLKMVSGDYYKIVLIGKLTKTYSNIDMGFPNCCAIKPSTNGILFRSEKGFVGVRF